jgi:acyl phosphate:glycerol-3-phosphate acyltransferase
MLNLILLLAGAYACGSIPFGKLIAATYGIDIQKRGSGNIGFANVRRIIGWPAGLLTLAGDITKSAVPTLVALHIYDSSVAFLVGFVAVLGHVLSIWLGLKGGKGVASCLGVAAVLSPVAAVIGSVVYVGLCLMKARSSTASATGALVTASIATLITPTAWWCYCAMLLLLAWTLRDNLWGTVPNYDN